MTAHAHQGAHSAASRHLYNSEGHWIAFRVGDDIFDASGQWIGCAPWDNGQVVTSTGAYVATICQDDRLFCEDAPEYMGYPGPREAPDYPGYPGPPPSKGFAPPPPGMRDLDMRELVHHARSS